MAVFAVGDIQGCYDELRRALDSVGFDPSHDRLWCVGDLVNRGPKSLQVLRFFHQLGDAAICVLGNHDLHLLALVAGNDKHKDESSLDAVMAASDRDELLHWLRQRPLIHFDPELDFLMVHAGLPPQWDLATALACGREVEAVLRGTGNVDYFMHMYGNKPDLWDPSLTGMARWRFVTNCLTRLRYVDGDGRLALKEKGPPGSQARGRIPWFEHPARASRGQRIVFGHWSTLGYLARDNVWALDTGCLWGGALTLLRLDKAPPARHTIACSGWQNPSRFA
ncbi:MAG: symmetrical bis(5'-nucleosyl)-tetraphosphatase [Gammaproteobacteria bacterium]|nr:symmetrical bis(5'-nucleosyl)-tetraphosphatase [Gammaproteobacteria bacterium]MCP5317451.1 symmetrical bis(5'-nucleosyl)-tetraphosphatase [Chromatiaceae bacterium]MCW5586606.1 symmetrical bis(5'-nucleosyl)-tetraphosphatase [Chromatiales bacterium]MCB1817040.1 symmetrical bis(5'-nucleosyl)-tetraphosphatase [Gammaproteobacteria bacterium]MCP5430127.1 symmetrical bis(5'-nucleosyl)-tetraphosphatase [Chromatiaceae bacterium]